MILVIYSLRSHQLFGLRPHCHSSHCVRRYSIVNYLCPKIFTRSFRHLVSPSPFLLITLLSTLFAPYSSPFLTLFILKVYKKQALQ